MTFSLYFEDPTGFFRVVDADDQGHGGCQVEQFEVDVRLSEPAGDPAQFPRTVDDIFDENFAYLLNFEPGRVQRPLCGLSVFHQNMDLSYLAAAETADPLNIDMSGTERLAHCGEGAGLVVQQDAKILGHEYLHDPFAERSPGAGS